ncbi:MAG: hypothetical protein U9R57_01305 [Thermodesulfobacteriota bacterium]|nr:hypothetical protein [Thermodesulfobacteriota bacterium]
MNDTKKIREIMADFAERTGLTTSNHAPKRYLWTDAFAVCNFLELFLQTGEEQYKQNAFALVDQVHTILGKHRDDDPRSGWISGLEEEDGKLHPTTGGLRIGKKFNERQADELHNERLEWDQDGQYFHYLTKWMHALNRVAQVSGNLQYNRWAMELAKTAHTRFTYTALTSQTKQMYWKMSIDLSRPLVSSMGQHDALDGLITYLQLMATAVDDPEMSAELNLGTEISEAMNMCENMNWFTDDSLGIGGLLTDAFKMTQLIVHSNLQLTNRLSTLLHSAKNGMDAFFLTDTLSYPAEYRLAFRELGLAIGLQTIEKMILLIKQHPERFPGQQLLISQLADFSPHLPLMKKIKLFWLTTTNQQSNTWTEHIDINSVMLATSLGPEGYLLLR